MYSLSICFGPTGMTWAFLFKEKEQAETAYEKAIWDHEFFWISDDFGQKGWFVRSSTHGVMLEDLDLTDEAKILRSLANARNEVKARQRAATDPVIRTAAQQGGPSVLTPFRQN